MANTRGIAAKVMALMGAGMLFCAAAASNANAQFQSVFGGTVDDAAQGGVIQVSDGNFVAVGHSASFSSTYDVYVVKSDRCGRLIWSHTYDIGGVDVGTKIRETADGGFIIVGSTENTNHCCTRRDAFLMRLDKDGGVRWARTYGGSRDDIGSDVILSAKTGGFLFAGSTSSVGAGDYDGWLTRTDDDGNIIWSRAYGGRMADGFRALDLDCQGNVMAAGYTRSHSTTGNYDIFVLMAGVSDGHVQNSLHYGGRGDELASSILSVKDYFYVAGYTTGVGGGAEGYILQAKCITGDYIADITYGGAETFNEDRFTEIKLMPNGNLVLSGYMVDPPNGFGSYDAWMTQVKPDLSLAGTRIYGGKDVDRAWSVAVVNPASKLFGLIMAGETASFGIGGTDVYEIAMDGNGKSGCNERETKLQKNSPGYKPLRLPTCDPLFWVECDARVKVQKNDIYKILCTSCEKLIQQPDMDLSDSDPAVRRTTEDVAIVRQTLNR